MAASEQVLWDVLRLLHGRAHTMSMEIKGEQPRESRVEHAFAVGRLKGELVLKYIPADIEDTIYFLKYRGYLEIHGYAFAPEMVYSLKEKAVRVFEQHELPQEERRAFEEALWEVRPRFYGVGPNLPEMFRRARRRLGWG